VLAKGGGGGIALERLKPYVLARDASGLRFSLGNAVKDLSYYREMASAGGAQLGIAEAVLGALQAASRADGPEGAARWVPELVEIWGR
jgi:3-hydroxyisobutyrate dehydrogenase-like beta-hydroxyacid dehydrogenase